MPQMLCLFIFALQMLIITKGWITDHTPTATSFFYSFIFDAMGKSYWLGEKVVGKPQVYNC